MIRNIVFCLAIITFSHFDCKYIKTKPDTKNPETITEKIITPQNETTALHKNNTILITQKNETDIKNNEIEAEHKSKIRQVSADIPMVSASTLMDDMNAEQAYYPSPLMVYPFPMMNTYYPRYFPYIYPGNQGNHFFG